MFISENLDLIEHELNEWTCEDTGLFQISTTFYFKIEVIETLNIGTSYLDRLFIPFLRAMGPQLGILKHFIAKFPGSFCDIYSFADFCWK